jgi:protein-L-isoaspartate(D-aspartate) O-methyltransferase
MNWETTSISGEEFSRRRARMVEVQLRERGIRDERVFAAMEKIPREKFVVPEAQREAYADAPLPIGSGQTISQPFMVATMIEALEIKPSDRVLEVGTGTGYQAALLAELAGRVWTIERDPDLAEKARQNLEELGYRNVSVVCADGTLGLPQYAPFDKILVAAGAPQVPQSLVAQLAQGGTLAIPVGDRVQQQLHVVRKTDEGLVTSGNVACCFVPLLGEEGWKP